MQQFMEIIQYVFKYLWLCFSELLLLQLDCFCQIFYDTTNFRSFETFESFRKGSEGFRHSKRLAFYQSTMSLQQKHEGFRLICSGR